MIPSSKIRSAMIGANPKRIRFGALQQVHRSKMFLPERRA
jgi:hypothetical protein